MTKAEEAALKVYPINWARATLPNGNTIDFDSNETTRYVFKRGYRQGYEQAEQNIVSLIESRIAEILGDAQPAPVLRAELRELIERIKEESK